MFAFSNAALNSIFDFYLVGFSLMAFGGPALHISFIHLSNLFGDRRATVISLLNGFFALSGYVFAVFLVRPRPVRPRIKTKWLTITTTTTTTTTTAITK